MAKDYFGTQNKVLNGLETLAVECGSDPNTINTMNALRTLEKSIGRLHAAEQQAETLGYSSLEIALKALAQTKDIPLNIPENLPDRFHHIPKLYLRGRKGSKETPEFKGLTLKQAQREHASILALLPDAWELADEEDRSEMLDSYLTSTPEEYRQLLHDYLHYYEDGGREEELLAEMDKRIEQERWDDSYLGGLGVQQVVQKTRKRVAAARRKRSGK